MNLLQPTALWALAAIPVILLFYILRPRHRQQIVPSVRLWLQLPSDLEGRPRFRLPMSSLLLFAQLLVAGAVAFSLARPAMPGAIRQHLIMLVDTSPTMLATDVTPNRLALAVRDARELAAGLQSDDLVTLISIEPLPRMLASGKGPHALDGALGTIAAAADRGDPASALSLASQTAQLSRDTHNRIVILSDGAFGALAPQAISAIPADVSFQQVGGSDDNQGITALSVRPTIGSVNRFNGFVQLANFSHADARVDFTAKADGLTIDRQPVNIPSHGHVEVSLPLPVGTHKFVVAINSNDKFGPDDRAEVLVPDSRPILVTLVASDPTLWERAFKTLVSVQLKVVAPGTYKPDGAAITLFDNFVPAALPGGSIVLIDPPSGNSVVPVSGQIENADVVHTDANSALFDSVDLAGIFVPQAELFASLSWATSIADSSRGPLILDGVQNGHRTIVLGFDPATTDWPQRISFPVFVANLVDSLSTASVPTDIQAGAVLDLPPTAGANNVLIQMPNGKIDVFTSGGRPIRFTDTSQLGSYVVTYANGSSPLARSEFVVNRLGMNESDIMPRLDPTQLSRNGSPPGAPSEHEIWFWVAGGALAVLGAEWLVYFRRIGG